MNMQAALIFSYSPFFLDICSDLCYIPRFSLAFAQFYGIV